jgi:uncharacterized protein (DUF1697 family)
MTAYASFLRAINVGGRNMIRMDALKVLHEDLGFRSVRTHLQSGNVVFAAKSADAAKIERAIVKTLGMEITVLLRTATELREVLKANPFPERAAQGNRLIVVFLSAAPKDPKALDGYTGPEEKQVVGRELYIVYGEDMGHSKLTNALIEKKLGVRGTARNWNTVTKMLELTEALEA